MAQAKQSKKAVQLSLEEYNKVKENRAKSKLKIHFPLAVKFFLIFPLLYFIFLFCYYLMHLRFVAEH